MGTPGWQTLPERLNNDQSKGEWREAFFKRRMDESHGRLPLHNKNA